MLAITLLADVVESGHFEDPNIPLAVLISESYGGSVFHFPGTEDCETSNEPSGSTHLEQTTWTGLVRQLEADDDLDLCDQCLQARWSHLPGWGEVELMGWFHVPGNYVVYDLDRTRRRLPTLLSAAVPDALAAVRDRTVATARERIAAGVQDPEYLAELANALRHYGLAWRRGELTLHGLDCPEVPDSAVSRDVIAGYTRDLVWVRGIDATGTLLWRFARHVSDDGRLLLVPPALLAANLATVLGEDTGVVVDRGYTDTEVALALEVTSDVSLVGDLITAHRSA